MSLVGYLKKKYNILLRISFHTTEHGSSENGLSRHLRLLGNPKTTMHPIIRQVINPPTIFPEDPFNIFFYLRPGFLSVFNSSVFSTTIFYVCRISSIRFVSLGHRSCSRFSQSVSAAMQRILFYTLLCSYSLMSI